MEQTGPRICLSRCPLPPPENVHSLPCHIHFDGSAPVKSYFIQSVHPVGPNKLIASFRGIEFEGQQHSLESLGLQGLVLENDGLTHEDDGGTIWEVDSHFDNITMWEVPNANTNHSSMISRLKSWQEIANALCD